MLEIEKLNDEARQTESVSLEGTKPNLPTKIVRMGMRIPLFEIKIMLESNPLKSIMLVLYGDWPYA